MKKRVTLTFVLVITIAAGLSLFLAGCGNDDNSSKTKRVIPPGTPKKVREQLEKLNNMRIPEDRVQAINELSGLGSMAVNAIPFLIDQLDDFSDVEWRHPDSKIAAKLRTTPANEAYKALGIIDINWKSSADAGEAVLTHVKTLNDKDASWNIKVNAAKALGLINDERSIKQLINTLNDKNEVLEVRKQAAYSLGSFSNNIVVNAFIQIIASNDGLLRKTSVDELVKQGEIAVEPLIALLNNPRSAARIAAMHALTRLGDISAINPIITRFNDSSEKETINIVNALEGFGKIALGPLLDALRSGDADIRQGAAKAVWRIGWRPDSDSESVTYYTAAQKWKKLSEIGKPSVKRLYNLLTDKKQKIRENAAKTLEKIGWKPKTKTEKVTFYLAARKWEKLEKIGKPAVNQLIAALGDETLEVRENAALVLGKIRDPRAIDPLYKMLNDDHSYTRKTSVEALANIGGDRVIDMITSCLYDKSPEVRVSAAGALGNLRNPRAIDPLVMALKDENEQVQVSALAALRKMGPLAYDSLVDSINHRDWFIRKSAVELLSRLKGAKINKHLLTAMKDEDWIVRRTAAQALQDRSWEPSGQKQYIDFLIATLDFDRLVKLGRPSVEPLIELLFERNPGTRKSVIWALSEINDRRAVQPLIGLLGDVDSETRKDAAIALGKFGDLRAVDPLMKLRANEKSLNVKKAVNETLKTLLGDDYEDALNE